MLEIGTTKAIKRDRVIPAEELHPLQRISEFLLCGFHRDCVDPLEPSQYINKPWGLSWTTRGRKKTRLRA